MNRHIWSDKEKSQLIEIISNHISMQRAELILGHNRKTIRRYITDNKELLDLAKKNGFFRKRCADWTENDISFISRNIFDMNISQIAAALNRTENAVLKSIRTNKIKIARKILSVTIDLEEQLEEIEKRIANGDSSDSVFSERNRILCSIETRKRSCKSLKNKFVKTIAILK